VLGLRRWRELVADRKKMEGHCSTGQSPQWAAVSMEEKEEEEDEEGRRGRKKKKNKKRKKGKRKKKKNGIYT